MNRRLAFTIVELLVVIAIIGVLVALILPAVAYAREASRRMKCANNLHNLALANINFEMVRGELPGYAQLLGAYTDPTGSDPTDPLAPAIPKHAKICSWLVAIAPFAEQQDIHDVWTNSSMPIVTRNPDRMVPWMPCVFNSTPRPPSWAPRDARFDSTKMKNVELFQCPSDTNNRHEVVGKNSYVANCGYYAVNGTPSGLGIGEAKLARQSAENGLFNNKYLWHAALKLLEPTPLWPTGIWVGQPEVYTKGPGVSIGTIYDGSSQTLMLSENILAQPYFEVEIIGHGDDLLVGLPGEISEYQTGRFQGFHWLYYDDRAAELNAMLPAPLQPVKNAESGEAYRINGKMKQRRSVQSIRECSNHGPHTLAKVGEFIKFTSPSSEHSAGVNVAMADGATRFLSQEIEYSLYVQLMTPHGASSNAPRPDRIITANDY